jgi:hypothetical protein
VVRIVNADGNEIARIEAELVIGKPTDPTQPVVAQIVAPIGNATFPEPGNYSFDILIDGRYEDSVPLYVRQIPKKK